MADIEATNIEIHPVSFPADILARVSPELSLQRHLSLGFRPSLRAFEEFRDVEVDCGSLSRYNAITSSQEITDDESQVLGSAILREGDVFVVTKITGGIIEDIASSTDEADSEILQMTEDHSDITKYCSVYPVVEVERGRMGACTDEEMVTSQRLYDALQHSKILSKEALRVKPGVRITKEDGTMEIIYSSAEDNDNDITKSFQPNKKWVYTLYAKIEVFGRTGPVFDMCWNSLINALKSVKLPRAFIDERATDLKMTVRTRGRNAIIRETYSLLCDPNDSIPLIINENNIAFASTYGIIDLDPEADISNLDNEDEEMEYDKIKTVLLADIDGEAEETCIKSSISIIDNGKGRFKQFSLVGGGAKITPDILRKSILLSKQRANDLLSNLP